MIRQTGSAGLPAPVGQARRNALGQTLSVVTMSVATAAFITATTTAILVAVIAALFTPIITTVIATLFSIGFTTLIAIGFTRVAAVTMPFLVARGVFLLIPVVLHEEDPFAAGAVAMAMLSPMPGMAGRNAQIERRAADRRAMDHHGLRKKQRRRREAADVEPAVETRLANIDGDLGGRRGAQCGCGNRYRDEKTFHVSNFLDQ